MKFKISNASGDDKPYSLAENPTRDEYGILRYEVEVNSLEDLLTIIAERDEDLILSNTYIIVYDDYVE